MNYVFLTKPEPPFWGSLKFIIWKIKISHIKTLYYGKLDKFGNDRNCNRCHHGIIAYQPHLAWGQNH